VVANLADKEGFATGKKTEEEERNVGLLLLALPCSVQQRGNIKR
jgi:hypothetical protein